MSAPTSKSPAVSAAIFSATSALVGLLMVVPSYVGHSEVRDEPALQTTVPGQQTTREPQPMSGAVDDVDVAVPTPTTTREAPTTDALATDPLAPITSPDAGEYCASGLDAASLTEFFSEPIGAFQGADYQRAFRLADDRVLWTFQDAVVSGTLVHNVGMIQSGRCFRMLNDGARSWLLPELTTHMRRWHWILDGGLSADGSMFHLFVAEMNESGPDYLTQARPSGLRRVVLDATSLAVVDVVEEASADGDLFGWSITSDDHFTYLYSHCYQQFGHDTLLGFGDCAVDVKLARIPRGRFEAEREYWDGTGWSLDPNLASPVVDAGFVGSGNNPAQIRYDGGRFVLIEKRDDWWGQTIEVGVADAPYGPFHHLTSIDQPLKCDLWECNTYFAAWVPWRDEAGRSIWSIGHNRWDGSGTHLHLDTYRPTFQSIAL